MRAAFGGVVVSFLVACSQGPSPVAGGGAGGGGAPVGGGGASTGGGSGGGDAADAGDFDGGDVDGGPADGGSNTDAGSLWRGPLDAYLKASNTDGRDEFGVSVALSSDGTTLVVGAAEEDSAATGIDGDQADDSALKSGAAYVYVRDGGVWTQQAYLKASNAGAGDAFGTSVSVSADGTTVAVGAPGESSAAIGINGAQNNNASAESGAVYVFVRGGSGWAQQAYVKASNADPLDAFGGAVSLSADGNTLAVGARSEASNAATVNGTQTDNSAAGSGAVYVFGRGGITWAQQAYVKASNSSGLDFFGQAVSLSGDGLTLAVGAYGEDSSATGVGGDQTNNNASSSGAAYVFTRGGNGWTQQAYLKASNAGATDFFGAALSLDATGATLAIGAWGEASAATGVDGAQSDNSADDSGAVYVFTRGSTVWTQQGYLKASNAGTLDFFGISVAVSADGARLLVGASGEDSLATSVNGNQADNGGARTGAAYVFGRAPSGWAQEAYLKAPNASAGDEFGLTVGLDGSGTTAAVSGYREDSKATGVDGDQTDETVAESGAVYVFRR